MCCFLFYFHSLSIYLFPQILSFGELPAGQGNCCCEFPSELYQNCRVSLMGIQGFVVTESSTNASSYKF